MEIITKEEAPALNESSIKNDSKINHNKIIALENPSNNSSLFTHKDFLKSGISEETISCYSASNYLYSTLNGWELIYPELKENKKSDYLTTRLRKPTSKNKYIRPEGETSRLFRPLGLAPESLSLPNDYIIITEGEKKAIKAVQEGFNCIALAGVWCWRSKKTVDGLIPDMHKINWKNKSVYLCFDNDAQFNPKVKQALNAFAEQLQAFGAIVKNIELPVIGDKKIGLDDYLIEYENSDFENLKNEAKIFESVKDKMLNLIKGISAVNKSKEYEWVIPEVFAKGYTGVLFGEAGSGKTWIILDLCLSLSNGFSVFNGIEAKQSKVLLFEGDAPDSMLKERINKLDIKLNDDYFKYVNRYNADSQGLDITLSSVEGRKNFETLISDFMPDLVVIDTLISFINDEKDAKEIKIIVDALRKTAEKYNCHILICHHSRKRESGETRKKLDQSDLIGSSVISRLASIIIGVDKNEQQ